MKDYVANFSEIKKKIVPNLEFHSMAKNPSSNKHFGDQFPRFVSRRVFRPRGGTPLVSTPPPQILLFAGVSVRRCVFYL